MPLSSPGNQAVGKTSPGVSRPRGRPTGVGSSRGATSGKVKPTSISKGPTSKSRAKNPSTAKSSRRVSPTSCKNQSSKRTSNHEWICDNKTIATATTINTSSKHLKDTSPVPDSKSDQQKVSFNLIKGVPKRKGSDLEQTQDPTQVSGCEEVHPEGHITNDCLLSRKINICVDYAKNELNVFTDELSDVGKIDQNTPDVKVLICEPSPSSTGVLLSRAINKKSLTSILKTGNTVQKLHSCGSSCELPLSDAIKEKSFSDDGVFSIIEESDTNCENKTKLCNLKSSTNFQKNTFYRKSSTNKKPPQISVRKCSTKNKVTPIYNRKYSTKNKIAPTCDRKSSTIIPRAFDGPTDRKSSINIRRVLQGSCDRKPSTHIRRIPCDRVSSTNIEKVAPCNRKSSTNFQLPSFDRKSSTNFQSPYFDRKSSTNFQSPYFDRKSCTNFQSPSYDCKSSSNIRELTSSEHVSFSPHQRHSSEGERNSTDQRPTAVESKKKAGEDRVTNRRLAAAYALLGTASSKYQDLDPQEKCGISQRQDKPKKNNQVLTLKSKKRKYNRTIGAKSVNKEKSRRKTKPKEKKTIRRTLTVNKIRHTHPSKGTTIKMKGMSKRSRRLSRSKRSRSRSTSPRKQRQIVLSSNSPPCPPEALNIATEAAFNAERAAAVATQAAEAAAAGAAAAMAVCNATGIEPFSSSNSRSGSSVPCSHRNLPVRTPRGAICYKYH